MNLKEIISKVFCIKEEVNEKDFDKAIEVFEKNSLVLKNALMNGTDVKHNDSSLINYFTSMSNNLIKEYNAKEKTHQNTSLIKNKYKELVAAIDKYNKLLYIYKKRRGVDGKSIGDCFRRIGKNTEKSSIRTKNDRRRNK
jgi:hypothetical protein